MRILSGGGRAIRREVDYMKKHKVSDYWNVGSSIGLCAAIGIVVGALLQNVVLWLCIGAGVGVVLGAVSSLYKQKKP